MIVFFHRTAFKTFELPFQNSLFKLIFIHLMAIKQLQLNFPLLLSNTQTSTVKPVQGLICRHIQRLVLSASYLFKYRIMHQKDLVASWGSMSLSLLSCFSNWFIIRMGLGGTLGVKMTLISARPGLHSLVPPFAAWFSNDDSIECRPCCWSTHGKQFTCYL